MSDSELKSRADEAWTLTELGKELLRAELALKLPGWPQPMCQKFHREGLVTLRQIRRPAGAPPREELS